jgi:hypothetical protein
MLQIDSDLANCTVWNQLWINWPTGNKSHLSHVRVLKQYDE